MEIILIILGILVLLTCAMQQVVALQFAILFASTVHGAGQSPAKMMIKNTLVCASGKIAVLFGAYVLMQFVRAEHQVSGWIALAILLIGARLFYYEETREETSSQAKEFGHLVLMFIGGMLFLAGFIFVSCFVSLGA